MRISRAVMIPAGALGGAAFMLALTAHIPPPGAERIRPVPDNGGAIRSLAIQFNPGSIDIFSETYMDLFSALPTGIRVSVVCRDEEEWAEFLDFISSSGISGGAFEPVFTGAEVTPWCRDRFVLAEREGIGADERILLAPLAERVTEETRENDFLVPGALAASISGIRLENPPFRFDGGDFLATQTRIFAGGGLADKNAGGRFGSPDSLESEIESLTGLDAIVLGRTGEVPRHHIGMFMTPIEDSVVLVGDPSLAMEILEEEGLEPPENADFSDEILVRFERMRAEIESGGLRTIGLPIVPFTNPSIYQTYNNVLMERSGGGLVVYMPVYDCPPLDSAAAGIMEAVGAAVRPIRVTRIFRLGGSVRCVVNVLERDDSDGRFGPENA